MRDFSVLSDVEFEALVGDLIGAQTGVLVERFAAGRDGGIDLRWRISNKTVIAQCKHYQRSTFSQLMSAAKKEVVKVEALNLDSYKFITSFDLATGQKRAIYELFERWMTNVDDVLGGGEVTALLNKYSQIERQHPKLWVSSGMQLFWSHHADIANRSEALRRRIEKTLPKYVIASSGYTKARHILDAHNVCLISGPPGIGKTSLAQMLLAEYVSLGYEPVEVSRDINEAWSALSHTNPQIFLYDDFLGQITFSERLAKNEDKRLSEIVEWISESPQTKLILTTREYILRDAKRSYERLDDLDQRLQLVLELDDYTRLERAEILYNHLWHSSVSPSCLREIASGGYKSIIGHTSYSPRLIEYCTGPSFDTTTTGYPARVKEALDNPERIWRVAFEEHLTLEQRLLVLILCSLPRTVRIDLLRGAHSSLCSVFSVLSTDASFRHCLKVLEGTFIAINKDRQSRLHIEHLNPSVTEFSLNRIAEDRVLLRAIIDSAQHFEQLSKLFDYAMSAPRGASKAYPQLMKSLDDESESFVQAMPRVFNSASPTQQYIFEHGAVYSSDPPGVFEDRLRFYIQAGERWSIDDAFIQSRMQDLATNWWDHVGDKGAALSLYQKMKAASFTRAFAEELHDALHTWLKEDRDGADDWDKFLTHLTRDDNVDLTTEWRLAREFEEAIDSGEIPDYVSDLEELRYWAAEFQLDDLVDQLDDAVETRQGDPDRYREDGPRQASLFDALDAHDRDSDRDLDDLFGRLSGESDC
ncbi:restriction endonuclease [Streptomyces boninensis]|uniref:nSTAND3 domain-containing NTPase n=1 Tax=Streptomyces boninensis TaxID=2039455 RepID=UPI003B22349E